MKINNIFKFLIVVFLTLQLSSCDNNSTEAEQKFDQTATERLNAQKSELNELLLSSEFGWKAIYFTDNTVLGGYTHLFKFTNDGTVQMASDFDSDTKTYKSEYQIQLGSTVSLVFTTKNRIHLLSDSNSYPITALRAKGYLGDFQFLYYGQENGEIIFKANRNGQEIRFVKAEAADWEDLSKNLITEQNIIANTNRYLFGSLEINDGTTVKKYDYSFTKATRHAISNSIDDDSSEVVSFGVGYTPTGIVVSPALVVADQKLSSFVYDDATGNFSATGTSGVTATIKYSNSPLVLTDDYKLLLPGSGDNVYGYIYNLTKPEPANSSLFLSLLGNSEKAAGAMLTRVQLWFNNADGTNYIEYRFGNANGATIASRYHYFTLTADAVNKTVTFTPGVWKSSVAVGSPEIAAPAFLKDLDDQFMDTKGLYFARTSVSGYTAYAFIAKSNPFRMVAYSFQ